MWMIRSSGRRRWDRFKNTKTERSYLSVALAKRCRARTRQCPSASPHYMRSWNSSEASWRVRGWTTVADWSDWDHDAGVGGTGSRTVAGHWHNWRRFSLRSDCRKLMTQLHETLTGAAHLAHLLAVRAQHSTKCWQRWRLSQPDASALSTNIKELLV